MNNVLAIGAHGDDVEFGCGGTLVGLEGNIHILQLCPDPIEKTESELHSWYNLLEIDESRIHFGNFKQTLVTLRESIELIEKACDALNPDFIFSHAANDTHQDHRTVHAATLAACRNRTNIYFYESYSTIIGEFRPSAFKDISHLIRFKYTLLETYSIENQRLGLVDAAMSRALVRAHRLPFQYAEAFEGYKVLL